MKYIEVIPDEIEKSEYRKMLAEKLNIQENTLSQYISTKEEVKKEDTQKEMSCKSSPKNLTEDLLMEIMLSDKEYWKEFLKWDGRMTSRINIIAQASKKLLSNNIQLTPSNLISWMNDIESSENINHWITKCALKDISHINKERKHVIFYDCLN